MKKVLFALSLVFVLNACESAPQPAEELTECERWLGTNWFSACYW